MLFRPTVRWPVGELSYTSPSNGYLHAFHTSLLVLRKTCANSVHCVGQITHGCNGRSVHLPLFQACARNVHGLADVARDKPAGLWKPTVDATAKHPLTF